MSYTKMHVYMYESMATTFREYKTIRMSEFYGMSQILIKPQPGPKAITEEQILIEGEDVRLMRSKMEHFCETYKGEFNQSQREVFQKVIKMP